MSFDKVKAWLEQATNRRIRNYRLKGILGLALGPVAVIVAMGFVSIMLMAFSNRAHRYDREAGLSWMQCIGISLAMVPVLFLTNRFVPRWDVVERRMSDPGTPAGRRAEGMAQIVLWILFTGPRLFEWAIRSFQKAGALGQQDTHSCAAVLWVLVTHQRKVPFTDFQSAVPWLDLEATLPEVRAIPGVLEFQVPPPGLGLTPELRQAICSGGAIEE
jgi:hypothetical protein